MIEIGEKFGGGRELRRRGWGVWSGVFLSPVGVGSGEGAVSPPQKTCEIFAWKWRILVAFFCHTRDFFTVQEGGMARPSGQMVNTPLKLTFIGVCCCNAATKHSMVWIVMPTFYCDYYFFAWNSGPLTLGGPLDFAYPAYPIVTPLIWTRP